MPAYPGPIVAIGEARLDELRDVADADLDLVRTDRSWLASSAHPGMAHAPISKPRGSVIHFVARVSVVLIVVDLR